NRFTPNPRTEETHTVFRRDGITGEITHYETYRPQTNPLIPVGSGASMPGGPLRKLNLAFATNSPLSREHLRMLLIEIANELVNQVNMNVEIQPFLKEPPFSNKNVQIIIYNYSKDGREVYDPEISTAQINESILEYLTNDPENTFKYKNQFEETYEEALKL